jgi:TonB family protein
MLFGWAVLASATGGMGFSERDYDDYTEVTPPLPPPAPVVDLDVTPPAVAPDADGSAWVEPRALAGNGVVSVALRNKAEVDQALVAAYPAELREQGVGGTVRLRVPLDDAGIVVAAGVEVIEASTTELGFAAASVAQRMSFDFVDIDDDADGTTLEVTVHFDP